MGYKIGFTMKSEEEKREPETCEKQPADTCECARKSVVQVTFDGYGKGLAYYNDRFDLRPGDLVFVDGKLEGKQGTVTAVNYNFKIKLSDYKRVISLVDTDVKGEFYMAGSYKATIELNGLALTNTKRLLPFSFAFVLSVCITGDKSRLEKIFLRSCVVFSENDLASLLIIPLEISSFPPVRSERNLRLLSIDTQHSLFNRKRNALMLPS